MANPNRRKSLTQEEFMSRSNEIDNIDINITSFLGNYNARLK